MSNSGLQDGREPISAAVCGDLFQGPQATQTLTPWRACPALRRVFAPGHSLQAGQAPWSCSLASRAVLQCQLHKDKWDGHAGVHRPTKRNSGVGHDCAQASSDPSVSDPDPPTPPRPPPPQQLVASSLAPWDPILCVSSDPGLLSAPQGPGTHQRPGLHLVHLDSGVETGEGGTGRQVEAAGTLSCNQGLSLPTPPFVPRGLSFLRRESYL